MRDAVPVPLKGVAVVMAFLLAAYVTILVAELVGDKTLYTVGSLAGTRPSGSSVPTMARFVGYGSKPIP